MTRKAYEDIPSVNDRPDNDVLVRLRLVSGASALATCTADLLGRLGQRDDVLRDAITTGLQRLTESGFNPANKVRSDVVIHRRNVNPWLVNRRCRLPSRVVDCLKSEAKRRQVSVDQVVEEIILYVMPGMLTDASVEAVRKTASLAAEHERLIVPGSVEVSEEDGSTRS